jgi:hypothetical protein
MGIPENSSLQEKLQHLFRVISGERFLRMKSLNNEVPFFICPYKPEEAIQFNKLQQQLSNQLEKSGVQILEINLYDLSIELLKGRGIWNEIIEVEHSVSKTQLKELLQGVLDSENHIVPKIADQISDTNFDVLFLLGVGEVYPFIRSHNVLNNLQSTAKDKPTVMFFPGLYTHSMETGASLDLFGKLHDDKYYRAFNIFHCEP